MQPKRRKDVEANRIAKYQHWKYSAGDQVDFFENTVNPKRNKGTIVEKLFNSQYKVRYDEDKYTKVNPVNMVPAVITDNPDYNKVKSRRIQGKLKNPLRNQRTTSVARV